MRLLYGRSEFVCNAVPYLLCTPVRFTSTPFHSFIYIFGPILRYAADISSSPEVLFSPPFHFFFFTSKMYNLMHRRWSHPPYYVPVHLSNQRFDEMQSADASLMQRTKVYRIRLHTMHLRLYIFDVKKKMEEGFRGAYAGACSGGWDQRRCKNRCKEDKRGVIK